MVYHEGIKGVYEVNLHLSCFLCQLTHPQLQPSHSVNEHNLVANEHADIWCCKYDTRDRAVVHFP